MSLALIATILAAIGGPAGLVAVIMVLPQIKKLQADTSRVEADTELTDIDGASKLSAAALAQMAAAVDRATRAEEKADRLSTRLTDVENELEEYRDNAETNSAKHYTWDEAMVTHLVSLGVDRATIEPPPPLLMLGGGRRGPRREKR